MADFGGVRYVLSDTGAGVVVADADNAQCFGDAFGQLAQVDKRRRFFVRHVLTRDRQMPFEHGIHAMFDLCDLFVCRGRGQ